MDNNNEIKTVSAPKKNRRVVKSGSYLVAVSAVVIAIVIAVNFFASALPQSLTQIDMSEQSVFTVGDEAKEILGAIDENVTVYLVCTEGSADSRVKKLLTDMDESSDFITFTEIDPATNPTFVSQYTSEDVSENSIIAVSEKRNTVVLYDDFYRVNVDGYGEMTMEEFQSMYQYLSYYSSVPDYTQLFYGEQEIVSAISYVTADEIPALYYTTGHGETELTTKFSGYISTENYLYTNLALVNHEIPEDAEAILINNPTNDFTEDEVNALITYVQGGGDVILMTSYSAYSNETHPNLAKLGAAMGLVSADGLVMEGNSSHYYPDYPYYLLPLIGATDDSSPASRLESVNIYILLTGAHGILQDESVEGVTVTPILSTTDEAFIRTTITEDFSATKQEGDVEGQYMVGAASTDSESGGRLVWYSSPDLVNDSADSMTGQGNSQLFVANLNWMAGKTESISILGKDVTVDPITVDETTMGIWRVIFCVIIPVAVVGAGLAVWLRRRRR